MVQTVERTHSLLSPSSAERWLVCTPSARMCEEFPYESNEYMEEGTTAHALGEIKLLKAFGKISDEEYQNRLEVVKNDKYYCEEIENCSDFYVETVKSLQLEKPSILEVEKSIDLSEFIPEGHGTADCLFIEDTTLTIVDYKHGQGVLVEAPYNKQLQLYALGAFTYYRVVSDIKEVQMVICQPRKNNVSIYRMSTEELLKFGEEVKRIAPIAWEGLGECKAGKWCIFCRAKATCKAQADLLKALEGKINQNIHNLTYEQLADVLDKSDQIIDFLNSVKTFAIEQLLQGQEIRGYRVVEGRSKRVFLDTPKAMKIASELIDENELYERKPISLASIEKKIGKKVFNEKFAGLVCTPKGSPTLAKEDDKRPDYNSIENAFKDL